MTRKQMSAKTEIVGCRFSGNTALKRGGAIEFRESGKVDVIITIFKWQCANMHVKSFGTQHLARGAGA